jgi:UDP-4-amino-4,6-dideoxy-N-acetyl-beta-L-altrosamine N-acetyltransferase
MLTAICEEHLENILKWRNAPAVRKNMYRSHEISWSEHLDWFSRIQKDEAQLFFMFNDGARDVGVVYFGQYQPESGNAFWGFYAAPDAPAGTGLRMEFAALSHAFEDLKLHKLNCEVIAYNREVINLHLKTGFIEEGLFRDYHFYDGQYHDVVRMGMLDLEWIKVKDRLTQRIARLDSRR